MGIWVSLDYLNLDDCILYYTAPLIGGGIMRRFCLTPVCLSDVCLSRISELSREQRGLGRLKLTQRYSPRHRWLGHHFHGQKVKVTSPVYSPRRLHICSYNGQRGNVLSVGNCCYVAVYRRGGRLGGARRYTAPTRKERGGAYRVATHTACYSLIYFVNFVHIFR